MVRLPLDLAREIDRLTALWAAQEPHARINRSVVVRAAIIEGLPQLRQKRGDDEGPT